MKNGAKQDIVFLEFGSHEETFYSHFLFLQERFNIHLIINEKLLPRLPRTISLASVHTVKSENRKSLAVSWETKKIIAKINPQMIFFNTAQGNIVRELCFLLPRRYKMMGVHHNADKLIPRRSFSQNLVSLRVHHYIVLADYVKENLLPLVSPKISLEDIYVVYYEHPEGFREIPKTHKLRVAIPGTVEQTRRDFAGLVEALKKTPLSPDVEFVILGNSKRGEGPALRQQVQALGLEKNFTFFDAYVSEADMASYMASSDAILPLMHPGMPYFQLFSEYKISGSYNWAYGYQKPMLMHERLTDMKTFSTVSIGYAMETLVETLNKLSQDLGPLQQVTENIRRDPRFNFELQKAKYDRFVEKALE